MASISMLSDVILTRVTNVETIKLVKAVQNASKLTNFLMNDLMDQQLLEYGHFTPKLENFDVI